MNNDLYSPIPPDQRGEFELELHFNPPVLYPETSMISFPCGRIFQGVNVPLPEEITDEFQQTHLLGEFFAVRVSRDDMLEMKRLSQELNDGPCETAG